MSLTVRIFIPVAECNDQRAGKFVCVGRSSVSEIGRYHEQLPRFFVLRGPESLSHLVREVRWVSDGDTHREMHTRSVSFLGSAPNPSHTSDPDLYHPASWVRLIVYQCRVLWPQIHPRLCSSGQDPRATYHKSNEIFATPIDPKYN